MADFLAKIGLDKLERAVIYGLILAIILAIVSQSLHFDRMWIAFAVRWAHVICGVMWVGLLWYFNFVQIPSMPRIPDEQKPAVTKVIAPTALFWFRWAALATVVTGLMVAVGGGYIHQALTFQSSHRLIGIGMWIGLVMAANVWFVIWPAQQKALGIVDAPADARKAAARVAMLTSRVNTMLSIPMLYFMVAQQNLAAG
ncbi:MAG: urate hydroxylase PuuD [Alphaproteobacteria bacterium]|nr:urate hydroxylase PuuD [Alphaproteobacteria bacterium]